jgi:hypothetical protein
LGTRRDFFSTGYRAGEVWGQVGLLHTACGERPSNVDTQPQRRRPKRTWPGWIVSFYLNQQCNALVTLKKKKKKKKDQKQMETNGYCNLCPFSDLLVQLPWRPDDACL